MVIRTAALLICLFAVPAFAEEMDTTPVSTSTDEVRLDHSDWAAGFSQADTAKDDGFPRLEIERRSSDDNSDYQSPEE